jgi:hypothetical protein
MEWQVDGPDTVDEREGVEQHKGRGQGDTRPEDAHGGCRTDQQGLVHAAIHLVHNEHGKQIAQSRHVAEQQQKLGIVPPFRVDPQMPQRGGRGRQCEQHDHDIDHDAVAGDRDDVVADDIENAVHRRPPYSSTRLSAEV